MKRIPLLFILLFILHNLSFAQSGSMAIKKKMMDSIKMVYLTDAAIRQPLLRQASVAVDVMGNANVDAKLNGQSIYKGKAEITRIRTNFTLPVYQWGKNSLSATVYYVRQHFKAEQDNSPQQAVPDLNFNKSTITGTVSFLRVDSIFGRPVIYSASITGLTNEASSIRRTTYIGGMLFPIKRTPNTVIMAGAIVLVDNYSPLPVSPYFSYWHKFDDSKLELTIDLPSLVGIRKPLSKNSWVTFGTSLEQNFTFYNAGELSFQRDVTQSTSDLKTGLSFEHLFGKKLMVGIRGGAMTNLSNRSYLPGDSYKNYFINTKTGTAPFFNVSVSLLPFLKNLIK